MREWQAKGVEVDVVMHRPEGRDVLPPPQGATCSARSPTSATSRSVEQLVGVIKVMLDSYSAGTLDRVFLCYNDFVNTMTQQRDASTSCCRCRRPRRWSRRHDWDYIYEPERRRSCSTT